MTKFKEWWKRRWAVVSSIAVLASITYLMGGQFTETHRINNKVDKVRLPVCSIMYSALSRPPTNFTSAQLAARKDFIQAYGITGLNCPRPLPPEAYVPIK